MKIDFGDREFDRDYVFKKLNYKPHHGQDVIHQSNTRFRYVCCGRRWGKTIFASKELFCAALYPNQRFWVVAPTYSLTEKTFREVWKDFRDYKPSLIDKASESEMRIKLVNGTIIECKSADNPDSLLGEGLNGIIIDEAARVPDRVWQEYLRPTLADKQGWGLFISTPHGSNWFYQGYRDGQQKINNTESWNFTTADNPYIAKEEIEAARISLPHRIFEQEFLGLFSSGTGGVFRNIYECINGKLRDCEGGVKYVIGVDLAKYTDFTVIIVIDLRYNRVVYFDRFNQIDYSLQEKRIIDVWNRFNNSPMIVDATGVGDRVYEELAKTITNLTGYQIKGSNKNELIDNLALMFDNKKIEIPAECGVLLEELNIFEYNITAAGNYRLEAPKNKHDDCVIALALACSLIHDNENTITNVVVC
jgi:hypothetical protein